MDIGAILIVIVIVVGCVAIAYVACQAMGVPIPPWVFRIVGIVIIVVVAVLALKFLLSML